MIFLLCGVDARGMFAESPTNLLLGAAFFLSPPLFFSREEGGDSLQLQQNKLVSNYAHLTGACGVRVDQPLTPATD